MGRHIATNAPVLSLWATAENAVRLTLKTLSTPDHQSQTLEELEGEQARIRSTGRHWLLG